MDIGNIKTEAVVDMLKVMTATQLTQMEGLLKCDIEPKREDFATEEEYQIEKKLFNMEMIESIEEVKRKLFEDILDSYNEYLHLKYTTEEEFKKQNEESAAYIIQSSNDIKNTGIVSLLTTFMFPHAFPVIAALGLSRIGFDSLQSKINYNRIIRNNNTLQEINLIQDPLYDFTCTLRTDYHQSKNKFKELKERAANGETILPELIEMVNPEKVKLERVKGATVFIDTLETEPKQLTKQREKNDNNNTNC